MENEHTNNCGEFRAVKEMPLPYQVNNNDDDDDGSPHESLHHIPSNLQTFLRRINKKDNQYKNNDDTDSSDNGINDNTSSYEYNNDNNTYANNDNIDIVNMDGIHQNQNSMNPRKTSFNNSINDYNHPGRSLNLKRSHSQELASMYKENNRFCNENNTIMKPNLMMTKNQDFDFKDPLNSNKTIHTYNVDSEFNTYLSIMKDNLTSIDTIIKQYDNRQNTNNNNNKLSIKIENCMCDSPTLNLQDKHDNTGTPLSDSKTMLNKVMKIVVLDNTSKEGDTLRIESESENNISDITNAKTLNNLFNRSSQQTIHSDDNNNVSSSTSLTANSESITIYS